MLDPGFFRGKRVLMTGHTGFKGSWMCVLLEGMGAEVHGYSLDPPTDPSLFDIGGIGDLVESEVGDVRDFDRLETYYADVRPDIVIHMAAQPIVREGYRVPRYTYETNVMGTVNILECQRLHPTARSFLNVTTDKVYDNIETDKFYRESGSRTRWTATTPTPTPRAAPSSSPTATAGASCRMGARSPPPGRGTSSVAGTSPRTG